MSLFLFSIVGVHVLFSRRLDKTLPYLLDNGPYVRTRADVFEMKFELLNLENIKDSKSKSLEAKALARETETTSGILF